MDSFYRQYHFRAHWAHEKPESVLVSDFEEDVLDDNEEYSDMLPLPDDVELPSVNLHDGGVETRDVTMVDVTLVNGRKIVTQDVTIEDSTQSVYPNNISCMEGEKLDVDEVLAPKAVSTVVIRSDTPSLSSSAKISMNRKAAYAIAGHVSANDSATEDDSSDGNCMADQDDSDGSSVRSDKKQKARKNSPAKKTTVAGKLKRSGKMRRIEINNAVSTVYWQILCSRTNHRRK
jgi:hypothetical protein